MAKKFNRKEVNEKTREEKIEVEGKVVEVLKGSDYLVELQNGLKCE
jgi:translation initiation factor IF-1